MRASSVLPLVLAIALAGASAAGAGIEIAMVEHLVDRGDPSHVRCGADSSVWVRAGGEVLRRRPGATVFEPASQAEWPGDRQAEREALVRAIVADSPVRDRNVFSSGLRSRHVHGACRTGDAEICWYGLASTGVSVHDKDGWHDIATRHRVRDLDVDPGRQYWAVTDQGLVTGPLTGDTDPVVVELPRFVPGNALDGVFTYEGRLHAYGTRGMHRLETATGPSANVTWTTVISQPVRDAKPSFRGMVALSGAQLYMFPGPLRYPAPLPGRWFIAGSEDKRVYLASATEVSSIGPGRPVPVMDVLLPSPPQGMFTAGTTLVISLAGPGGGLLLGRLSVPGAAGSLVTRRLELTARCVLAEATRLLVGTDDGLASVEDDRVHWYFPRPDLAVTAIASVRGLVVLATDQGLMVLDGPAVAASHPLGAGGGEARVSGLAVVGDDVWACTQGQGLYRLRIGIASSPPAAAPSPASPGAPRSPTPPGAAR